MPDELQSLEREVKKRIAAEKTARQERLQNNTSFQKLADKYGVSKHTIQDAITGKHWAHVVMPEPPKED